MSTEESQNLGYSVSEAKRRYAKIVGISSTLCMRTVSCFRVTRLDTISSRFTMSVASQSRTPLIVLVLLLPIGTRGRDEALLDEFLPPSPNEVTRWVPGPYVTSHLLFVLVEGFFVATIPFCHKLF